jgi:hypothetical protein
VFKSSATKPDKLRRLALPQLIDEKPEFIDPENETKIAIEDAIKNALPKFRKGDNNMLIITPNMNQQILVMMAIQSMTGTNNLIQDEIRRQDKNRLISAVLVLEPTYYLSEGKVNYYRKFIPII